MSFGLKRFTKKNFISEKKNLGGGVKVTKLVQKKNKLNNGILYKLKTLYII